MYCEKYIDSSWILSMPKEKGTGDMRTDKGEKIIRRIAKEHKVNEMAVRKEMEQAIMEGYQNPQTRQEWNRLFGSGHIPTPEEFIAVMAKNVKKREKKGCEVCIKKMKKAADG